MFYTGHGSPMYGRRGKTWRLVPQTPATPSPRYGPLIRQLSTSELSATVGDFKKEAVISDCKFVASYNWMNTPDPTILIPGRPARWTPLSKPTRLPEDSGDYFRDRNAARFPKHPMEPAVRVALETSPRLRHEHKVDIVACCSTLGNLLRAVWGHDKPFRILVELVDGTVFFIRRENSPKELIPNVHGFGHTFPENYTTWGRDVKGSTSH